MRSKCLRMVRCQEYGTTCSMVNCKTHFFDVFFQFRLKCFDRSGNSFKVRYMNGAALAVRIDNVGQVDIPVTFLQTNKVRWVRA